MDKMYICEKAKECSNHCDNEYLSIDRPNHKIPHKYSMYCRKAKCLQSGETVQCVEVEE